MYCRYTALMHKVIYRRQGKAGKGDWSQTQIRETKRARHSCSHSLLVGKRFLMPNFNISVLLSYLYSKLASARWTRSERESGVDDR